MENQEDTAQGGGPARFTRGGATTTRIFVDKDEIFHKQPVLPWRTTLYMSWGNMRNRAGRFALILVGIAVVMAFLMYAYTSNLILDGLARCENVHVQAMLVQKGMLAHDAVAEQQRHDQQVWLLALSCILCVVVIANTMLMSVTERTSEIGTIKCLGALDRFIVRMFLVESIFLGAGSSLVGVLAGYLLALLQLGCSLGFGALGAGPWLAPVASGLPLGVGLGTLLTVVAASYPAYVAAKMKPVDAMRAEI